MLENYIKRERYLKQIRPLYHTTSLIKVLSGIRRCGKSVLLEQIIEEIISGGVEESHIIRINFEDSTYRNINSCEKLETYIRRHIVDDNVYYIFLDEIQHIHNFEKVLASIRATLNCSIFVTGSNSKLLAGKMGTLLVGRCYEFRIMPFSFMEAYEYVSSLGKAISPYTFIMDYLRLGGFPERFTLGEDQAIEYIRQTYNGIIERDIIGPSAKSIDEERFKKVCEYILMNSGKEFSPSNISRYYTNINESALDPKTIYSYMRKMEKACLINRVKRYYIAGKQALSNIEKQYCTDISLRTINLHEDDYDLSYEVETIIYNELISRGYTVYVGKTYKGEVDFIVMKDDKKCYIQSCYYLANQTIVNREFSAFSPINDNCPKYVISLDQIDLSHNGITHLNIVDFLLGKTSIRLD